MTTITDHVLTGGRVDAGTDPDELFVAFMGYAQQLGREYRALQERMVEAGINKPRLAITELQLFADFVENREVGHHGSRLTSETMPTRTTVSEPLYLATIVHECVRMRSFIELLTHSATVNHGGGLQKKRERTWPDPAHHGHVLLRALAGGTPLGVDVDCKSISTERSFGGIEPIDSVPVIDAVAVEHQENVILTLVNRTNGTEPIELKLDISAITEEGAATISSLSAKEMSSENTYQRPERVSISSRTKSIHRGELSLTVPSYSLLRITI